MRIKLFKKEKNFKKEKSRFSLGLCWEIAVYFMLTTVALTFFFGYYLFTQINKELIIPSSGANEKIKIIKKEKIDEVLEYFSARKQKSNEILNSPASITDPSL